MENKIKNLQYKQPDFITIKKNSRGGYGLYSNKEFIKGDILYTGREEELPNGVSFYVDTNVGQIEVKSLIHAVKHTETTRLFYGFDSFTNHSCEPNTYAKDTDKNRYIVIAVKDIKIGDELTSNYLLFDLYDDDYTFYCKCGYEKCFKKIGCYNNLSEEDKKRLIKDNVIL